MNYGTWRGKPIKTEQEYFMRLGELAEMGYTPSGYVPIAPNSFSWLKTCQFCGSHIGHGNCNQCGAPRQS